MGVSVFSLKGGLNGATPSDLSDSLSHRHLMTLWYHLTWSSHQSQTDPDNAIVSSLYNYELRLLPV